MGTPMQRSRAKARTEETAENSTRATIRRTRQTDDNGANGPSQAGDSGGPAAHGSDQDFDQRILGMEKAMGTAFYRNNLGEYGWVNRSTSQSSSAMWSSSRTSCRCFERGSVCDFQHPSQSLSACHNHSLLPAERGPD